jgi:hypothetical protein
MKRRERVSETEDARVYRCQETWAKQEPRGGCNWTRGSSKSIIASGNGLTVSAKRKGCGGRANVEKQQGSGFYEPKKQTKNG